MADSSSSPAPGNDQYLQRAYALTGSSEAQRLYDEWADSYDTLTASGYASPRLCVETILKNVSLTSSHTLKILDAGCGTGLVGDYLVQSPLAGNFTLHGVDLTPGMLAVARGKGVYQQLEIANLNERIAKPDGSYDVVTCVGVLTKGHVGPKVFAELARLTASSGLIVATVLNEIWESGGYRAEVEQLQDTRVVEIVSTEEFGMVLDQENAGGRMVVLKKE